MLAASLLVTSPALAQSNLERVVNGDYTPSHDFDLLHQRIEVKNFDWGSTSFDGRVTTTVASMRPGLQRVVLDMERRMEVRSVTAAGKTLAYDRPGDSLVVRSPAPSSSVTPCASPWTTTRRSRRAGASTSSRPNPDVRTGRSRSTAAAGPTETRAGCPPSPRRTTRRHGSSSPPCRPR